MGMPPSTLKDMEFLDVIFIEQQLYKFLEQEMEAYNNG